MNRLRALLIPTRQTIQTARTRIDCQCTALAEVTLSPCYANGLFSCPRLGQASLLPAGHHGRGEAEGQQAAPT